MNDLVSIQSISELLRILEANPPKHPLVSVVHHESENLRQDFGDTRYVMDLYYIALKDGQSTEMGYGRNSYDFQEGSIIFMKPGQVIQPGNRKTDDYSRGWTLAFHPDLIRNSDLGKKIDEYDFFSYEIHEALHLSTQEKIAMSSLVDKIEEEYSQNTDQHTQKLIVSTIELLLDYCTRYYDRQFYTRSNLNKDLVTQFEQLLEEYYKSDTATNSGIPTVQFCGEALNMSPYYLSTLLKKETGRSAQEHIHFYLINRAKTQLLNSSVSISQIAYSLGFEYPQHFSKLFKSKTGISPVEYRRTSNSS